MSSAKPVRINGDVGRIVEGNPCGPLSDTSDLEPGVKWKGGRVVWKMGLIMSGTPLYSYEWCVPPPGSLLQNARCPFMPF